MIAQHSGRQEIERRRGRRIEADGASVVTPRDLGEHNPGASLDRSPHRRDGWHCDLTRHQTWIRSRPLLFVHSKTFSCRGCTNSAPLASVARLTWPLRWPERGVELPAYSDASPAHAAPAPQQSRARDARGGSRSFGRVRLAEEWRCPRVGGGAVISSERPRQAAPSRCGWYRLSRTMACTRLGRRCRGRRSGLPARPAGRRRRCPGRRRPTRQLRSRSPRPGYP
jgi:hypothetical protein